MYASRSASWAVNTVALMGKMAITRNTVLKAVKTMVPHTTVPHTTPVRMMTWSVFTMAARMMPAHMTPASTILIWCETWSRRTGPGTFNSADKMLSSFSMPCQIIHISSPVPDPVSIAECRLLARTSPTTPPIFRYSPDFSLDSQRNPRWCHPQTTGHGQARAVFRNRARNQRTEWNRTKYRRSLQGL